MSRIRSVVFQIQFLRFFSWRLTQYHYWIAHCSIVFINVKALSRCLAVKPQFERLIYELKLIWKKKISISNALDTLSLNSLTGAANNTFIFLILATEWLHSFSLIPILVNVLVNFHLRNEKGNCKPSPFQSRNITFPFIKSSIPLLHKRG